MDKLERLKRRLKDELEDYRVFISWEKLVVLVGKSPLKSTYACEEDDWETTIFLKWKDEEHKAIHVYGYANERFGERLRVQDEGFSRAE
jgi:hypothetical protein